MDVILNNSSGQPFYEQIVQQVKRLVQTGRLQEGDPLPSMRQLAKDLRVSVITTKRAYEELEQAGYLCSVAGRGSFAAHPGRDQVRREQTSGWTNIWRPPPPSPGRRASPGSSFWSGWGNGTRRKTKWNIHRIIY